MFRSGRSEHGFIQKQWNGRIAIAGGLCFRIADFLTCARGAKKIKLKKTKLKREKSILHSTTTFSVLYYSRFFFLSHDDFVKGLSTRRRSRRGGGTDANGRTRGQKYPITN